MKRFVFGIIAILSVFALVMTSCSSSSDSKPAAKNVTITFNLQGGTITGETVTSGKFTKTVAKNAALGDAFPGTPTKAGAGNTSYVFKEWSRTSDGSGLKVDAETTFAVNTEVFAIYNDFDNTTSAAVTFYMNDGTSAQFGEPVIVTKGQALGESFPEGTPTRTGFIFVGWATTNNATTANFDETTEVIDTISVYAIWSEGEELPPLDLYPLTDLWKPTVLGDFTVSNSATQKGWATVGVDEIESTLTIGTVTGAQYLVLDMRNEPTGTVQFIWQGDSDEWGWNQTDITTNLGVAKEDLGVTINTIGDVVQLKIDLSLVDIDNYDNFKANTKAKLIIGYYSTNIAALDIQRAYLVPFRPADPGPDPDTAIVEEFQLNNGWFAIFQFTLPNGKKWNDYKHVKADYKIADTSKNVRARVFGNYTQSAIDDVRLGQYTSTNGTFNVAVVDTWPSGDTGSWILDNTWQGYNPPTHNEFDGYIYPSVADNEWFTIFYPELGKNPHGQFNNGGISPETATGGAVDTAYRYKVGRNPAINNDVGPFYLGLGFTNVNSNEGAEIRSQITNIVLYGDGVPDVPGVPLYIKKDGDLYRAFAGQLDGNRNATTGLYPNLNGGRPEWKIIQGEDLIASVDYVEPTNISITYDLNYPNLSSGTPPNAVTLRPGDRFTSAQANVVPTWPSIPPTTSGKAWVFDGWYTAATGGGKIVDRFQFDVAATIYAHWREVDGVLVTFDAGTGVEEDNYSLYIETGKGLLNFQFALPSTLTAPVGKVFGGWYLEDPSDDGFNYKDYTKLVKNTTTFSAATTIYAYWYTPVAPLTFTINGEARTVEALGGARIDEEGYVIFAAGAQNAYLNGNANDTLLSVNWGTAVPTTGTTLKITYKLLDMIVPTVPEGNTLDAALAWKNGYNSWSGTSADNYVSWDRTEQGDEKTITKLLSTFGTGSNAKDGFSIQINAGDDANNHQTRAGYVYGIKIVNIEIVTQ